MFRVQSDEQPKTCHEQWRLGYNQGYYEGMNAALHIVRQTEPAPQTRATERQFGAAKGRITRRLAGAVECNDWRVSR